MVLSVTLTGGLPWGFKMIGGKDFHLPLTIGKVFPGSKASKHGVSEGYVIEKVNGEDVTNMSHHEAQNRIKSAGFKLTLYLSKPKPRVIPEESRSTTAFRRFSGPHSEELLKPNHSWHAKTKSEPCHQGDTIAQSPSLYTKTQPPIEHFSNSDRPTLVITKEMRDMIIAQEDDPEDPGEMKASHIKIWEPKPRSSPQRRNSPSWQSHRNEEEKSRAADNIGRFLQNSSAPRYGEPTFAKTLRDLAGPLGEPTVLEVRLGSVLPVPTVHWYHNKKETRESIEKDIRILSNGPVRTLVLGELTHDLLGDYTCTIINSHGSKSCRCVVTSSPQHRSQNSTELMQPPVSATIRQDAIATRRVVPSSSIDLYSKDVIQNTYHARVSRETPRLEDSEVLKALHEDSSRRYHSKTPSMKHLEEILLPESDDL